MRDNYILAWPIQQLDNGESESSPSEFHLSSSLLSIPPVI
jgi:hypothetical protein